MLVMLTACAACTTPSAVPDSPPASSTATASPSAAAPAPTIDAGVELPPGAGREILVAACLDCHRLTALALFKGFYTRESWRSLLVVMVENGAEVDDEEIEVLTDYLEQHFGPDAL